MRAVFGLLLVAAVLVAAGAGGASGVKTEVVRWSPLDASGRVKGTLKVESRQGICGDIGYTLVGGIGYRCTSLQVLYTACFRAGPGPTTDVICAADPWDRRVVRLHSPGLLFYPGVTFSRASTLPWALELTDGNRCRAILTGSGPVPTPKGLRRADFGCPDGLALAALQRDQGEWQISAVRYRTGSGYGKPKYVGVRGAYFGALPPAMTRQNNLAHQAHQAAATIVHKHEPKAVLALAWVRLTLPTADWAYVIFELPDIDQSGRFVVLHRVRGSWRDASANQPYCTKLPKRVSQQLFLDQKADVRPDDFQAPHGEIRC